MRKVIAEIANISMKDVSIKATTTEKLGFLGREEGIASFATVLLQKS
jgi:2-C-methyl-D-erythritol 2,4-cyclodiphosphate synthase